jgi:maltooligosyltrehalose synthase
MGGGVPAADTRKLFIILRLLGLRARRPELFAGAGYRPLDAGPRACAFLRGDDLLVVVGLDEHHEGRLEAPGGHWRSILRGDEYALSGSVALSEVLGRWGVGVFERLAGPLS